MAADTLPTFESFDLVFPQLLIHGCYLPAHVVYTVISKHS